MINPLENGSTTDGEGDCPNKLSLRWKTDLLDFGDEEDCSIKESLW